MKKLTYLLLITISLVVFNSCEDDSINTKDLNYISFEGLTYNFGVALDNSSTRDIKVYSTQITGSDRTFNVKVLTASSTASPAAYTVPSTVTIPANSNVGLLSVNIKDLNIGVSGKKLVLSLESKDDLYTSNPITLNITQLCQDQVNLKIVFDGYASECSWKLFDSSPTPVVLASGSGYKDGAANTSTAFCLKNGTYTFTIYDQFGDGLSYPANGNATITYKGVTLVSIVGDFGSQKSVSFTIAN